jgi:alpha-D-xyloside xylohydrolase
LYRRWAPFSLFSSHSRCHGQAPKEPWEFSESFLNHFRNATETRYRLMPYIYAQAKASSEKGLPMLRALFVEFPQDPGSWLIENEYLLGSDMLVAPLFETGATQRNVYLPQGKWIDYQTGKVYDGGWHVIEGGKLSLVVMIRDGAVIPHAELAQSTDQIDWSKITLQSYTSTGTAKGKVCLPAENVLQEVNVTMKNGKGTLVKDPYAGKVKWMIK